MVELWAVKVVKSGGLALGLIIFITLGMEWWLIVNCKRENPKGINLFIYFEIQLTYVALLSII